MELEFSYPSHLKGSQERAEQMVDKFMEQMFNDLGGKWTDPKIKLLTLSWIEED